VTASTFIASTLIASTFIGATPFIDARSRVLPSGATA
jgi:hypothetical protein